MNSVSIIGRLGKDPEVKNTNSGKSVLSASIAVEEGFGDRKVTNWYNIEAWDKTAEAIQRLSGKGKRIAVSGRLSMDSWEDRESGKKQQRVKIIVNQVDIIDFVEKSQADGYADDDSIPF